MTREAAGRGSRPLRRPPAPAPQAAPRPSPASRRASGQTPLTPAEPSRRRALPGQRLRAAGGNSRRERGGRRGLPRRPRAAGKSRRRSGALVRRGGPRSPGGFPWAGSPAVLPGTLSRSPPLSRLHNAGSERGGRRSGLTRCARRRKPATFLRVTFLAASPSGENVGERRSRADSLPVASSSCRGSRAAGRRRGPASLISGRGAGGSRGFRKKASGFDVTLELRRSGGDVCVPSARRWQARARPASSPRTPTSPKAPATCPLAFSVRRASASRFALGDKAMSCH